MTGVVFGSMPTDAVVIKYRKDASVDEYIPLRPNPSEPPIVIPVQGTGDMFRAVYDTDQNGVVDTVDQVDIGKVTGLDDTLNDIYNQIGSGGGDGIIVRVAAEEISALRIVSDHDDGIRYADPTNDASVMSIIGITVSAGGIGDTVRIRTSTGQSVDDSAWNWSQGFVFLSNNGQLTQIAPSDGWEVVVGYAPSKHRINLTFDEPIKL